MCGSSKIFLMPPTSFGVQTRVTRTDPCGLPLSPNKTLPTVSIILIRFSALVPPALAVDLPGCGEGNLPVMFLMRSWDQLGPAECALAQLSHLSLGLAPAEPGALANCDCTGNFSVQGQLCAGCVLL